MKFKQELRKSPLQGAFCKGLQALRDEDKHRITTRESRRIQGSADLDAALEASCPDANRWDYVIGYEISEGTDRVYFVEVHSAQSSEVETFLRKFVFLERTVRNMVPSLWEMKPSFHWIATSTIDLRGPKKRQLAEKGIRGPQKHLILE